MNRLTHGKSVLFILSEHKEWNKRMKLHNFVMLRVVIYILLIYTSEKKIEVWI